MKAYNFLVTCEQCGYYVPPAYAYLIRQSGRQIPESKDRNILKLTKLLAHELKGETIVNELSHLLIDRDKSLHANEAFSPYSTPLSPLVKKHIIRKYYHPYREQVTDYIQAHNSRVFHIILRGISTDETLQSPISPIGLFMSQEHLTDLDLLRKWELKLSDAIHRKVLLFDPERHEVSSRFSQELRQQFSISKYLAVEISISQNWLNSYTSILAAKTLSSTLLDAIHNITTKKTHKS
ncbi:MAG: hypothetical protein ACJAVN_002841 [Roseivirga sp.]|jgi:hypothetical protein